MVRRASGFARRLVPLQPARSPGSLLRQVWLAGLLIATLVGAPAFAQTTRQGQNRISDPVLGVTLDYPAAWKVVHDPYLFSTYGFVLQGAPATATDDHGRTPVARIAVAYDVKPEQIETLIQAKIDEYPGVPIKRWHVQLGEGLQGTALGLVPGGQVSINLYVAANDRVYQINYYGEKLDRQAQALLASLRFSSPTRSIASLNLLDATSDEVLQGSQRSTQPAVASKRSDAAAPSDPGIAAAEYRLADGCWAQPTTFFIQTTHSYDANSHEYPGWSRMGTPNFWGENTHGNWGLGKCTHTYYTNDYYAIDYYLNTGDMLYSPFKQGYVTYAGWDPDNWWNYGKMVVIKSPDGKYWSLSAHMSAINVRAGQYVTDATLIGWAGSTGYADPYPHVHQVFYRYAQTSAGRPYGGQGLKQTALTYLGNGGGVYSSFYKGMWTSW